MKNSRLPAVVTALVLVFFYLPLGMLVLNSFNGSAFGGTWGGWTLKWYDKLFHSRDIWPAVRYSLLVAGLASLCSMVLGTLAALALHRFRSPLQRFHSTLIYTPLVIPDVLMGMSLLLFFVGVGWTLGLATVTVAHISFCVSYVALVVLARLQDFDETLVEAARDLGATRWQAAWRILVPLLAPGILAGGLLAFTLSIDDFVITFFVKGAGMQTLPTLVYGMIKKSREPAIINALSALLVAVTFVAVLLAFRAMPKRKGQES